MKLVIFFIAVFCVYHLCSNRVRTQNIILIVASTLFYSWFEWKYTALVWGYVLVNYFSGLKIQRSTSLEQKKFILICSILFDLEILAVFKYYNFFSENIIEALSSVGIKAHPFAVDIIFPIGISFYCFQCVSYVVDVYYRKCKAEESLIVFSAFLLFFPKLVAGPIERAGNLIPQFCKQRVVSEEDINLGLWAIIWGVFNKIVIADTCILLGKQALADSATNQALLYMGTLAFGIGIYADFNGYSLIAIGSARLLGFHLSWNFIHPHGAKSICEFWKCWHISLSKWLKNYLYIPLGGDKKGFWRTLINLIIVMLIYGIWHGPSLNFIVWGGFHGMILSFYHIYKNTFVDMKMPYWLGWALTQMTVFIGWYLFAVPANEWNINFLESELVFDGLSKRILITTTMFSMILFAIGRWQIKTKDMYAPARLKLIPYSFLLAILFLSVFVVYTSATPNFIYSKF